jgi:hypothetical protein
MKVHLTIKPASQIEILSNGNGYTELSIDETQFVSLNNEELDELVVVLQMCQRLNQTDSYRKA